MKNRKEKDPFQEYDKFWDELDKIEEAKEDEDYFKEKNLYKSNKVSKIDNDYKKMHNQKIQRWINGSAVFFFAGIGLIFWLMPASIGPSFFFRFQSIMLFVIFVVIILGILNKLKYK